MVMLELVLYSRRALLWLKLMEFLLLLYDIQLVGELWLVSFYLEFDAIDVVKVLSLFFSFSPLCYI